MINKKILIVEDNELNLRLFSDLLKFKGADVYSLKSGKDFFEVVDRISPDLILMDIQLDEISGLDLISRLKSSNITKFIPIIAITAFAMRNDEKKIMQSGCEAYISKPVSIDKFYLAVDQLLQSKKLVS